MHSAKRDAFRVLKGASMCEGPRHSAHFGCRLVGLSGKLGFGGLVNNAELLSPLLSGLAPEEALALRLDYDSGSGRLAVALEGTAHAVTHEEAVLRQKMHAAALHALIRAQFPGFLFRRFMQVPGEERASANQAVTELHPAGRRTAPSRAERSEPGPHLVEATPAALLLPPLGLSPQRLLATIELLKARGESATLTLSLRRKPLDAAALRLLRAARDAAVAREPRSSVEAMRQLTETVSDEALMSALLDERSGIELSLAITTPAPLDEAVARMLCHAVFGAGPASGETAAEFDLSSVLPRAFALPRVVAGLAAAALVSLEPPPTHYDPPDAGGVLLGHTHDGRAVEITERDRARHSYVIGAVGTGKSSLLLNMLAADMEAGKGLILLDPHGDLWEEARRLVPARRGKDLVLAHLGDPDLAFSINVLQGLGGDPAIERDATVNSLIRLFKNTLWPGVPEAFGPMFEMYFRNALLLMMEVEGETATILDFERVFHDDAFRRQLVEKCQTQAVRDFWRKTVDRCTHDEISLENITPYIVCKMSPFTSSTLLRPVLGSPTSSLDLIGAIAKGQIVLVNLAKGIVGEGSARLLGGLITMRLVTAAQTQMRLPPEERRVFVAFLDEFQTYATEHLAEGIEETRKYCLQLVLANQSLGQIDGRGHRVDIGRSIVANVANLIAFRLGVEDAHVLARWLEPGFSAEHMMYMPDYTAVARILSAGRALRPVEFRTSPPPRGQGA